MRSNSRIAGFKLAEMMRRAVSGEHRGKSDSHEEQVPDDRVHPERPWTPHEREPMA
jgi:hypothetical protein